MYLLWTWLLHADAAAQQNVRVLTYDTALDRDDGDFYDGWGQPLTNVQRAAVLADRILASDYEIVALQDVGDGDARAILDRELTPAFPFAILHLGGLEPSNLMLFSKHPFVQVDASSYPPCGTVEIAQGGTRTNCAEDVVAYEPFRCEAGRDLSGCGGGAGLVRIAHPSGQTLTVAFADLRDSLQADVEEDDDPTDGIPCQVVDERRVAMGTLQSMITNAHMNSTPMTRSHLIVLGNLGMSAFESQVVEHGCYRNEWAETFRAGTSLVPFYACAGSPNCSVGPVMVDSGEFATTNARDVGRTRGYDFTRDVTVVEPEIGGGRVDYVVLRGPVTGNQSGRMVPQHPHVAWSVAGPNGELSDHLPVGADILLLKRDQKEDHSTPIDAEVLDMSGIQDAGTLLGADFPGQVQWAVLTDDAQGTYSIRASSVAAFDIYADRDLSRPIQPRKDGVDGALVYHLVAPPYFVKSWLAGSDGRSHDRTATGTWNLTVHEHDCTSPEEACLLRPAAPEMLEVVWPALTPVGDDDAYWFEFYADDPSSGQTMPASHHFLVTDRELNVGGDERPDAEKLTAKFFTTDLDELDADIALTLDDDGTSFTLDSDSIKGSGKEPSWTTHLLMLSRDPAAIDQELFIGIDHTWNMTYFVPGSISLLQEEDDSEHDELMIYLGVKDGDGWYHTVDSSNVHEKIDQFTPIAQIDEIEDGGSPWSASVLGTYRLTGELGLLMVEDDNEGDDPEEGDYRFCEPWPHGQFGTGSRRALGPYPEDRGDMQMRWLFTDDPGVADDDSDYRYAFTFEVSHLPPEFSGQ